MVDRYGDELSLVMLDIVMPGISGFEVLADLSRRTGIDNLPVIMISSEDSDDMVLRAYELAPRTISTARLTPVSCAAA